MLKNWDINLRKSEKKTLGAFLLLYLTLSILLLSLLAFVYFDAQKNLMLQNARLDLSSIANEQIERLRSLHVNFETQRIYPRDNRFESAIFDSAKEQIFATKTPLHVGLDAVIYLQDGQIYFIKELESYYLGAKYLVLQIPQPANWINGVYQVMLLYGGIFLVFMMAVGYFLMKLFLKPMRDAIKLLDRFIKDTTHELNTPISTILSNIEMIDMQSLDAKLEQKLKRIDIGARTVSNLYQDLTYLMLSHKIISENTMVAVGSVLAERVEYFTLFADSKKITIHLDLQCQKNLFIDRKKLAKIIDNLLSNAIKYNKIGGKITVLLLENFFEIQDNGRGVPKEMLGEIFKRYARADVSVGGFGIGLSIVMMIASEYHLQVSIDSQEHKFTKVRVAW
ncbi:MAG: HAMP domain-containing histidine kinase [Sulfurospirillum sp.]|nr:HAMP domain-containing histidine kinase [Sulfurospirillum sp.]